MVVVPFGKVLQAVARAAQAAPAQNCRRVNFVVIAAVVYQNCAAPAIVQGQAEIPARIRHRPAIAHSSAPNGRASAGQQLGEGR
ncbi:MAG: hypothetical protein IJ173_04505, partial [Kiritimatiellae bacterium]|nr:hypothetical protein [Kiritimatiellia bacterium]